MTYLLINHADESNLSFYIETDENDMELRKIELADGGLLGFAGEGYEYRGTKLFETPLMTVSELSALPKTNVQIINKEEFDSLWDQAIIAAANTNFRNVDNS